MGGGARILEAATLVDRDVDQHRARLHVCDSRIRHQFGCLGAGHQHRANHQVGLLDRILELEDRRVPGLDAAAELGVDLAELVDADIEDRHMSAHPRGDARRVVAGGTGADDHDVGGLDARHAAHQHTASALRPHQVVSPDLGGHRPDLTHRGHLGNQPLQWERSAVG